MQEYKAKLEPDKYYHIYNRANGKEKLFKQKDNYDFFLKKYNYYISPFADTYAYCLLPNHFHFLVRINSLEELKALSGFETLTGLELSNKLSRQFSHLFNTYTQAYNKVNNKKGSLFTRSFNRKHINSDEYLKETVSYIHMNPLSHGLVKELDEWRYSSYKSYFNSSKTNINTSEVLKWFDDLENFKHYHNIEKLKKHL